MLVRNSNWIVVVMWARSICKQTIVLKTNIGCFIDPFGLRGDWLRSRARSLFAHVTSVFGLSQPFEAISFLKHCAPVA